MRYTSHITYIVSYIIFCSMFINYCINIYIDNICCTICIINRLWLICNNNNYKKKNLGRERIGSLNLYHWCDSLRHLKNILYLRNFLNVPITGVFKILVNSTYQFSQYHTVQYYIWDLYFLFYFLLRD